MSNAYKKYKIDTTLAPRALGAYSQAVVFNSLVFVSGQLPLDPKTGKLIEGDMGALTRQVIDNIEAILKEAGTSLDKVLRCDVFLKDLNNDFSMMNEEYARRFTSETPPARQTIQVGRFALSSPVEISCVAFKG